MTGGKVSGGSGAGVGAKVSVRLACRLGATPVARTQAVTVLPVRRVLTPACGGTDTGTAALKVSRAQTGPGVGPATMNWRGDEV
jgi:hypothetical protein